MPRNWDYPPPTRPPYFPFAGNGGYDVQHYDLAIRYQPPAAAPAPLEGQLEGVMTPSTITFVSSPAFAAWIRPEA